MSLVFDTVAMFRQPFLILKWLPLFPASPVQTVIITCNAEEKRIIWNIILHVPIPHTKLSNHIEVLNSIIHTVRTRRRRKAGLLTSFKLSSILPKGFGADEY